MHAMSKNVYSRWPLAAVLIIIAIALTGLWLHGRRDNFLVYDMEFGETALSINAAKQYAAHGAEYGLLENLGTETNPKIYTHSVNIGTLTFVLLEALGIHDFSAKVLLPLCAFGIGLFYVYLAARLFSRSEAAAIITLLVFATTYWGLGAFALNALRAWHMLAFFAVCYHVGQIANTGQRRHWAGISFAALVAFGCGYDFWIICVATAAAIAISEASAQSTWRKLPLRLAILAAIFTLPFALRQGQVIYAFGAAYWWQDIIFSLAIKIPGASNLIHIPNLAEVDAYYRAHHILRPPAAPTNSIYAILITLERTLQRVTIPRWGIVTLVLFSALLLLGVATRAIFTKTRVQPPLEIASCLSRLLLPMSIGIAIGVAVLAPFSLNVYLKHEFPLVAFPFLLAKGVAIYWLAIIAIGHWEKTAGYMAITALAALLLDAALVHRNGSVNGLYPNFDWTTFVKAHSNATFLLSTYRPISPGDQVVDEMFGVSGTDHSFDDPTKALETAKTLEQGVNKPNYWIYQRGEEVVDVDAPVPTCQVRDWLLGPVSDILPRLRTPRFSGWIAPSEAGLGTALTLGGTIRGYNMSGTIEVKTDPPIPAYRSPAYNCIYGTMLAWLHVDRPLSGTLLINVTNVRPDGGRDVMTRYAIPISRDPKPSNPISLLRPSQPTIDEVIEAAKGLRVVEQSHMGIGYVIFEIPR